MLYYGMENSIPLTIHHPTAIVTTVYAAESIILGTQGPSSRCSAGFKETSHWKAKTHTLNVQPWLPSVYETYPRAEHILALSEQNWIEHFSLQPLVDVVTLLMVVSFVAQSLLSGFVALRLVLWFVALLFVTLWLVTLWLVFIVPPAMGEITP